MIKENDGLKGRKRNKVSDKKCRFWRSKSIEIVSLKKGRVWIRNRKARIRVSGIFCI